jgi:type II secretory pathway predicted ATPase ExeA
MYESHFGFNFLPFENTPDQRFYFDTRSHNETIKSVMYTLENRKGISVIVGRPGTGKTLIVQRLIKNIREAGHVIHEVDRVWSSNRALLNVIPSLLDIKKEKGDEKNTMMDLVKERLKELTKDKKRFVILIDEAQQLSQFPLESLRRISTLESESQKLIQIILAAQPEFLDTLRNPYMESLRQRIAFTQQLQPLDNAQTTAYIKHRIETAGGDGNIFQEAATNLIFVASGGIPRLINQACDNSLIAAYHDGSKTVDTQTAQRAIDSSIAIFGGPDLPPAIELSAQGSGTSNAMPTAVTAEQIAPAPMPQPAIEQPVHAAAQPQIVMQTAWNPAPPINPAPMNPQPMPNANYRNPRGEWRPSKPVPYARYFGITAGILLLLFALIGLYKFALYKPDFLGKSMAPKSSPTSIAVTEPAISNDPASGVSSTPTMPRAFTTGDPRHRVTVSNRGQLTQQLRNRYGIANESYEDLLAEINPDTQGFSKLSSNSAVLMPPISTEHLLVTNATQNAWYVYYGSFRDAVDANFETEVLKSVQDSVALIKGERFGTTWHRLFIGPFSNQGDANQAASSVWFKHLTALN